MSTLDAASLLSDPAPIWLDNAGLADPAAMAAPVDRRAERPLLQVVSETPEDPLAQALPWLVRHLGVAAAVEAVVGPVDDEQPAASDDVLPALRRIGFDAHIERRTLASFAAADLPAVLLLRCGDACVLTRRWLDAGGQAQCHVVLPGPQAEEFDAAEHEIGAEYSGVALVVSPPKLPFAAALARSRQLTTAATAAAAVPPAPTPVAAQPSAGVVAGAAVQEPGQALVALAAAMQNANRAMRSAGRESGALSLAAAASATRVVGAGPLFQSAQTAPGAAPLTEPEPPDDTNALSGLSFMRPAAARGVAWRSLAPRLAHGARWLKVTLTQAVRQGLRLLASRLELRRTATGGIATGWLKGLQATSLRIEGLARPWVAGYRGSRRLRDHLGGLPALVGAGRAAAGWFGRLAGFKRPGPAAQVGARPGPTTVWRNLPDLGPPPPARREPHLNLAAETAWPPQALPRQGSPDLRADSRPRSPARPALIRPWADSALARHAGTLACALVCLLVGAPLAWARMVSTSSVRALQIAPTLLRGALGADPERAVAALAQSPATEPLNGADPPPAARVLASIVPVPQIRPRLGARTAVRSTELTQ